MKTESRRQGNRVWAAVLTCVLAMTVLFAVQAKPVRADETGVWPFQDVAVMEGDWVYESVSYVYNRHIMTGLDARYFGTESLLARAQFAVILYRMNGKPPVVYEERFPDVKEGTWYSDAVLWANSVGIVNGYEDGNFGPADVITREQMLVMMYRYAKYMQYDTSLTADLSGYPDALAVSDWAWEAMRWAVGSGVIHGDGGYLNPQGTVNRVVCATIIMNFLETYDPLEPEQTPEPEVEPTPEPEVEPTPEPEVEPTPEPTPEQTPEESIPDLQPDTDESEEAEKTNDAVSQNEWP